MTRIPNVLTVAGSDSGGGAGIQADIKTISAHGTYAASVITALTAQNTQGVRGIHEAPSPFVRAQIDAIFEDIRIDAVKVGMLAHQAIIEVVAERLAEHQAKNIVLDPVMVSKSEHRLLRPEAVDALRRTLLPRSHILTPNLPEAGDLLGRDEPRTREEMVEAGEALRALGPQWVLIKGGHRANEARCADVLIGATEPMWIEAARIDTKNTHGTGCTLSSAIAARLARGASVPEAVRGAKSYLTEAIARAHELDVGRGHGPVHHFHAGVLG